MEKIRKYTALISVIVIIGLVITAFILGIMGSKYFWGVFFLAVFVPVVLWIFMWFTRLVTSNQVEDEKELK